MDVKLKPYSDPSRWVAVYPLYIDVSKSLAQGRRIPKAKAISNPTCQEIYDVLNHVGLRCELEAKKMHPRAQSRGSNPKQQQQEEGRVRVQLKGDDGDKNGTSQQQTFMSRQQMMEYAAEMIPKLKTRQQQNQGEQQQNDATGKQKKRK